MPDQRPAPTPLLDPAGLDRLRVALDGFTVDGVESVLGLSGAAALARGDLAGANRAVDSTAGGDSTTRGDSTTGGDRVADLARLFVLGRTLADDRVRAALAPLGVDEAFAAGLVERAPGGGLRAALDVRPYAEADDPVRPGTARPVSRRSGTSDTSGRGAPWWVVSDLGCDLRPGPLPADHVLGVGRASLLLAQVTPRDPVGRALDLGTGCGVQALHLAAHSDAVVATDVSTRALRCAATTAALSGQSWDLRQGPWLEPVAGHRADGAGSLRQDARFDLVVANPPFVVSPAVDIHDYRDSGEPGDVACARLVRRLPSVLAPGGSAVLLANWAITTRESWDERVTGWLDDSCDAWVWQREVADPGEYVTLWLRDAGLTPAHQEWTLRYDAWCDWFERAGVLAVGLGVVALWAGVGACRTVVLEDVPQPVAQPIGPELPRWIARQRWLRGASDGDLFAAALVSDAGLVRSQDALGGPEGWRTEHTVLRQATGMRWEVECDAAVAALVAGCDGEQPLGLLVDVLAAATNTPVEHLRESAAPVVRDLVGRGILHPPRTPARRG